MYSVDETTGVLVIHWGSSGAGPRLMRSLAAELAEFKDLEVHLSYVSDTETSARLDDLALPSLKIRTYSSRAGLILGLPRMALYALKLRGRIRRDSISVVISPMSSIWQALALPLILGRATRYISSIHDANPHPGEGHWLSNWCQKIEMWRADVLLVFSGTVEAALRKRGTGGAQILRTVHPIFAGEILPSQAGRTAGDVWKIGFFGRILPYKGLGMFTEAIRILLERGYKVDGVVWGDGDLDHGDQQEDNRHISWNLGWVPETQVNAIVASFDILALPYIEASQSGVLAVAMAERVPAVATPVGGLIEQIESTGSGVLSEEISAESFAEALVTLIEDSRLYRSCQDAAEKAAATTHSWRRVADDVHASVVALDIRRRG